MVHSSISYTLPDEVENLYLTGTADIDGIGNALDNAIRGNAGKNVLIGGDGNDVYRIDINDTVVEYLDGGIDTIKIASSYTLGTYIENLTLIGSGNFNATGNDFDNILRGNAGDNIFVGGLGGDSLIGGRGFDTADYSTSESGVYVSLSVIGQQETVGAGADTLSGIDALIGSSFDDVLSGGNGPTQLDGGAGNDRLISGRGVTVMLGGADADIFVFQNKYSSTPTKPDNILDFNQFDGDLIDLSGIDANVTRGHKGDQSFFLGGSTFTHQAGELIQLANGDDWMIEGDINGDGNADFTVALRPVVAPLTAIDFIL